MFHELCAHLGDLKLEKLNLIYEGKAKKVYKTSNPDFLIQEFKDDATAFNAKKRGTIRDKGIRNNKISSTLFNLLESKGVATHFVKQLSDRDMPGGRNNFKRTGT